jgi:hypothetical protein
VVRRASLEIVWSADDDGASREPLVLTWSPPASTHRRALISLETFGPNRPIRSKTRARLVEGIASARLWLDALLAGRHCQSKDTGPVILPMMVIKSRKPDPTRRQRRHAEA